MRKWALNIEACEPIVATRAHEPNRRPAQRGELR
jgi:hypothetical protein